MAHPRPFGTPLALWGVYQLARLVLADLAKREVFVLRRLDLLLRTNLLVFPRIIGVALFPWRVVVDALRAEID
jgi:hypothetical protein